MDNPGPAAHWRRATRQKVASSYGRFLTFASLRGQLGESVAPEDLNLPELLRGDVGELRERVSPVTLGQRLTDLHEAFRVMAPDADFEFLRKAARRASTLASPTRHKAGKIVHPRLILELAIRLMEEAERLPGLNLSRACRDRDGLLLALLAARPIRLGNLAVTVPIVTPLVTHLGFDPFWWGIVMVVVIETGLITPPFGINVFVLKSMVPDVPLGTIFRGVVPFVAADLVKLILLVLFPAIALWLPSTMQ